MNRITRFHPALSIALAFTFTTTTANAGEIGDEPPADQVVEYDCSVLFEENGRSGSMTTEELRVLHLGPEMQFHGFESDDDRRVTGILCRRSTVLPAPNDYQVPQAGYPLGLLADDRSASLELVKGRYVFRVTDGAPLSRAEQAEVDRTLASYPKPPKKKA